MVNPAMILLVLNKDLNEKIGLVIVPLSSKER